MAAQASPDNSSSSIVFIGVDGGGTKTEIVAVDYKTQELCRFKTGSTNQNSVGEQKAKETLLSGIAEVLRDVSKALKTDNVRVGGVALGMAGVDRPADIAKVKGWVQPVYKEAQISVFNDAVSALASGTGGSEVGIVLISGTGMICYGQDQNGVSARAGGWGVFTDGGSGYDIGVECLKAAWGSYDTTGPKSSLEAAVLQKLGLQKQEELIPWTYSDTQWHRIASLTPLVFQAYKDGDQVAIAILKKAASQLARAIEVVARKLKFVEAGSFTVVLAGSVSQQPELVGLLSENVKNLLNGCLIKFIIPVKSSADGAALLAANKFKSQ